MRACDARGPRRGHVVISVALALDPATPRTIQVQTYLFSLSLPPTNSRSIDQPGSISRHPQASAPSDRRISIPTSIIRD